MFSKLNFIKNMRQPKDTGVPYWEESFDKLRKKWGRVPAAKNGRVDTQHLLTMADQELVDLWCQIRKQDTTGEGFQVRGWYHLLYEDVLRHKRIMDVGCGLGIDGITFAQSGASVTFVDIAESNVALVSRICNLLQVRNVDFCYLESISSLSALGMYDVIWCQGSMHNAPFEIVRAEAQELVKHLKVGGRWIQLAYPKTRWEREGKLPFNKWGEKTDGPGTPWCEWYDLQKLLGLLEPIKFNVVLYFEFHNGDFNWFDLLYQGWEEER